MLNLNFLHHEMRLSLRIVEKRLFWKRERKISGIRAFCMDFCNWNLKISSFARTEILETLLTSNFKITSFVRTNSDFTDPKVLETLFTSNSNLKPFSHRFFRNISYVNTK